MRERKKAGALVLLVAALLAGSLLLAGRAEAAGDGTEEGTEPRALFISSYSYEWSSVPEQISGLSKALGEAASIEYVFMDAKVVDDEASRDLFYQTMRHRMSVVKKYDIVIVGDDPALQFAMDHKEELFPRMPIVFEAVDDVEKGAEAGRDPMVTGIVEQIDYKSNIDLALRFCPGAKRVVAILDDTLTGQGLRKQFYQQKEIYSELEFEEINCSKLSRNEIRDRLMRVGDDAILFFLIFTEDGDGNVYSSKESVRMVTKYASVPVYRMVGVGIGEGVLGGKVISHERMGEMAGEMAARILGGESPESIDVVTESPAIYCFDREVADRFQMSEALFPEGSVFVNEAEEEGKGASEAFVAVLLIVLALLLAETVILFLYRRSHSKRMERLLMQLDPSYSHDTLTGNRSRMAFLESLQRKIDRKQPCAVILTDVDNFNKINDEMGHSVGDQLLREIGARVAELEDGRFKCYRIGGDEFACIVRSDSLDVIDGYVEKVQKATCAPFLLGEKEYIVQFSTGIALYPKDGEEAAELVSNASIALKKVKRGGADGYSYYGYEFR